MSRIVPVAVPNQRSDQLLISPRDIVYIMFRRRVVVFAVWIPILLVAVLGLLQQTERVTASSKVLLTLNSPQNPRWNTSTAHVDYDLTLSTYANLAMSVPVIRLAAEILQNSVHVMVAQGDGAFAGLDDQDRLAEFLMKNVDVMRVGETSILELRFGSSNETVSLMANRAMQEAFLKYSISATRNEEALDYYDEQVDLVRGEIDSLLMRRSEAVSDIGYSDLKEEIRHDVGQLNDLKHSRFENQVNIRLLQAKITSMHEAAKNKSDNFPLGSEDIDNDFLLVNKIRVDRQVQELTRLLGIHTENSPIIQRQRELLSGSRVQLAAAVDDYIRSHEIELEGMNFKDAELGRQITVMHETLLRAPEAYRQTTLLDSEINSRIGVLDDMQVKQSEVRLAGSADERVSQITKMSEPTVEMVVSKATKYAYFGLISVFGLLMGILGAFVVDRQDHRFHNVDQVSQHLEIPVLGSISQSKAK